jgi:3D (Asp-Asp-Asp) domain-containing protein/peptidoglycan hydrolase CwlO-like protein
MWRDRTKSSISGVSEPQERKNITFLVSAQVLQTLLVSPGVLGGRESRLALGLALTTALLLGVSLAGAQNSAQLRTHQRVLASKSHTALLGLYALDSRLSAARIELARIHTRVTNLRDEEQQVRQEAAVVAENLRRSQRQLADHLRRLYEQDQPNALAILLGAKSLDDAVTQLNALEQTAKQGADAATSAQDGRATLERLAARLAARIRETNALEARARQTASALAAARAQRVDYLVSLAHQRRLNARELATLQARARQVVAHAQTVQAQSTTGPPAFVPGTPATITVTATGYSLPGHTSTGLPVGPGVVAVDPAVIPLGTRLTIPGYGQGVAADTGSAVSGYTIDLWFPTLAGALAWGRRTVTITLH